MGIGVIINAAAIVAGAAAGVLLKNVINEKITLVLTQGLGVTVLGAGILDLVGGMGSLSGAGFKYGALFLVLCVVLGGAIGSALRVQDGLEALGALLQRKLAKSEDSRLGEAFVQATMVTCVGAMVVYGSIRSGLGDDGTLYLKSVLDAVVCLCLAAKYGFGVSLRGADVYNSRSVRALRRAARGLRRWE